MELVYINIDELTLDEKNAKIHNSEDLKVIEKSIRKYQFCDPIGVWGEKNLIVEGHGRYYACKNLGIKSIPCIRLDHLTDKQRQEYAIVHNKSTMLTGFNEDILKEVLPNIGLEDFKFDFGLDFDIEDKEVEEVEIPSLPKEPKAKLGDIYLLGNHRLMCGDSTKSEDVAKLMDGIKADMIFTDPPYGMNLNTDWSNAKSKLQFYKEKGCQGQGNKYEKVIGDNDDFTPALITTIFNNFDYCSEIFIWGADYYPELLKNYKLGNMFVWDKRSNDDTNTDYISKSDKMFGSQFELCWSKSKHRKQIARVKWAGIFGTEKEFDKARVHPTQKPTALAGWFINKYSKENNLIVDLYGGSGSTLIACEQLNRYCYMMELDPKYCDVIIERWQNYTGKKAIKLKEVK